MCVCVLSLISSFVSSRFSSLKFLSAQQVALFVLSYSFRFDQLCCCCCWRGSSLCPFCLLLLLLHAILIKLSLRKYLNFLLDNRNIKTLCCPAVRKPGHFLFFHSRYFLFFYYFLLPLNKRCQSFFHWAFITCFFFSFAWLGQLDVLFFFVPSRSGVISNRISVCVCVTD